MKKVLRALPLVLILTLAMAVPAFAQEYCGDLEAEDCDLLYQSNMTMQTATEAVNMWDVDVSLQNVPQVPASDIGFTLDQTNVYSLNDDAAEILGSLMGMDAMAMQEAAADTEAFAESLGTVLAGLTASVDMDVTFSDELAGLIEANIGMPWPTEGNVSARLADGILYFDNDGLVGAVPGMEAYGEGWVGLEFATALGEAVAAGQGLQVTVPGGLISAQPTTLFIDAPTVVANLLANQAPGPLLTDLAPVDPTGLYLQYLIIDPIDGEEMGDEATTDFLTTFDLPGFLSSDIFGQLLMGLIGDEAQVNQLTQLAPLAGSVVGSSLVLELNEIVGSDTGYLYDSNFTLDLDLSTLVQAAAAFGAVPGLENLDADNSSISVMADFMNEGPDADTSVEVPEDATMYMVQPMMQ